MPIKRNTLALIFFVSLSGGLLAQSADEAAPPAPNEGICDELRNGTPGLYGLCVAFSEAQDCEPDFSLDDPFESCKPSDRRLLELYDKLKTDLDPPMPGIYAPCPCWTEAELQALRYPDPTNVYEETPCLNDSIIGLVAKRDLWMIRAYEPTFYASWAGTEIRIYEPEDIYLCRFGDICTDGNCTEVSRNHRTSAYEYLSCTVQLIESGIARGHGCWD